MRLNVRNYRTFRAEKDISDEEVRKAVGLSQKTLLWLLNDSGGVSCEVLEGIAEVLGCLVGDISLSDLDEGENMIEWNRDAKRATLTLSQGRTISRVKKLAEKYPDEVEIIADNGGKILYAHVPVTWIKINPPRELTEEQKKEVVKRLSRK